MNKITKQHALRKDNLLKKFVKIMRLTIACLLIACLHVSASGYSQDNITLNLKSVELRKALIAIEKKTDYRFLFNENLVAHRPRVDINVVETPVIQVLDQLLQNTGITYKVLNNRLVVLKEVADEASLTDLQDIRVAGRVTNAGGDGMAGVSVAVKGTRTGTVTNATGNFALTVPDNAVLVFSYVGFEAKEVPVAGQSTINVQLTESVRIQEQVVVIGYGTASKRDLTGSIVKISGKEVQDRPNTNPIASLQGKVAGLSVVNNGTPGQAPDIRIRGTVSIGQVHPLYVVDGIFEDNIDYINPNDIESIEVLKDPSSLAIFGVKGATGVIAITTKRARAGQVVVSFNTSFGFKKLVDKIKMANAAQFNQLFTQEENNNDIPDTARPDLSKLTANTDWIDAVTRSGVFNNNNISISQSTDKNRFTLGLGYIYDEGIIKHEKLEKMLLSFNDEVKLNKAVKIGVNLNASRQHNPYDATGILDEARKAMPSVSAGTKSFRVQNPYGTDTLNLNLYSGLDNALQNSGVVNPLLELENTWNKVISIEYRTVGSIYADLTFLKYFNFRSTFYADISTVNRRQYTPLYYAYDPLTSTPYLYSAKTQVTEDDQTYRKFQQDHVLTFKKNFGDHNITATAGFTTFYFGNFNRSGVAKPHTLSGGDAPPIPDNKRFWYMSNYFIDASSTFATSYQTEYSTVSALGRILYNYKGKYYLNASLRDDASSQIPGKNRHQKFWAVGAAWELTREGFMKSQDFFDFIKIKGSIGVLGNQSTYGIATNYPFYPNLSTGTVAIFGNNIYNAADEAYRVNPDLKWETVHAGEVGVELNAFKNRLHFEFNYFDKVTKDLMTYISLSQLGLKDQLENGGSLKNWGEEFTASWNQNVNRDLTINVSGNITFLKNKVLSLSPDLPGGIISRGFANNGSAEARTMVGQPIGSFYGYILDGLYQSYADILASPVASSLGSYRPGDFKFKDINGPTGKGPDGQITADDRTIIGNPTPKFTYGGTVNLTYKGFNLAVDVGGVYGNQVFRVWGGLESPFQRVNYPAYQLDSWTGPGTSNWVPIISQADRFNYNGSTYNIEDGSYFRIRNIQLGYSFGKDLISKWRISNLRVFANVQNFKTWKNNFGYTPEFGGDATGFGFDFAGGAIPVVTTFGLNVTF